MVTVGQSRPVGQAPRLSGTSTSRPLSQATPFCGSRLPGVHSLQPRRTNPATVCSAATAELQKLGPDLWNTTYYPTGQDAAALYKDWFVVDAEGQTLGRLAVLVANHLRGKNRPTYTPSMDMGAFVVIINAEKVVVSGNKYNDKLYRRHTTGRPGSMKTETFRALQERIPERIVEKAVRGMLPRGKLGNALYRHLKVYKGPTHPHEAQQPVDITAQINAPRPSNAKA